MLSRLSCSADGPSDGQYRSMVESPRSASHLRASEIRIRREQRLLPLPSKGTSMAMEPPMSLVITRYSIPRV